MTLAGGHGESVALVGESSSGGPGYHHHRRHTPGVVHAHARARWRGRTLRVEVEGWVKATTNVAEANRIGRLVADRLGAELPEMRSFTWTARGV